MKDREFDKKLKSSIQKDKNITSRANNIFLQYQTKEIYETKNIYRQRWIYAIASCAACLIILSGGATYAHINGIETFISPLLRNLGINSKYEENAVIINEKAESNTIKIEMLDMAIDESVLIAGYKINIGRVENWIKPYGEYKINSIDVQPNNITINRFDNENYIVYQIFDISDIDLENRVTFEAKFDQILEYTEVEDLQEVYAHTIKEYEGEWKFKEEINVKNISKNINYKFDDKSIKFGNVEVSIDSYVKSSFTNMIKVKMNKKEYNGDYIDYYYIICDENGNEIAAGVEEKVYDKRIEYDRIFISEINENQKLTLKIISNNNKERIYKNTGNIEFSLSEGKEIKEIENKEILKYENEDYTFNYKLDWKFLDNSILGPNSLYRDALIMSMPSSILNEDEDITIFIKNSTGNLQSYVDNLINGYKREYWETKEKINYKLANENGYKIIEETSEGDVDTIRALIYICEKNGIIYEININGTQKEFHNNQSKIEEFVESFSIK